MRVGYRNAAVLTLLALSWAGLAAADELSGLTREDSLDANAVFGSGFLLQQFEAHRHIYADARAGKPFGDRPDDAPPAKEKLGIEWLGGVSMFRSQLGVPSTGGAALTDENIGFHLGADMWLGDQVLVGVDGGIQNTPEEDFDQGLFHMWFQFLFPLRSGTASDGSSEETAKGYYERINAAKISSKVKASEIYPQLRIGGRFSFLHNDKGPDELGRSISPLQSHVILNQSENTGIVSFYPSPFAEFWAGFTKDYYDQDPSQLLSQVQFVTRIPTGLALGLIDNFADLMQAFPNYGIKGGVSLELGQGFDLQAALVYDSYNLQGLTSTFSVGAAAHVRLGSAFKLSVGGDVTSGSGPTVSGSNTTGGVGIGYYL